MSWSLAHLLLAAAIAPAAQPPVLVAVEPGVEAYAAAVAGLTAVLGPGVVRVVELQPNSGALQQAMGNSEARVLVAVGARALAEIQSRPASVPVIAAMVLSAGSDPAGGRVELEIPLGQQLEAMKGIWPRHTRAAIVRNPARARYSAEALENQARKAGFTAVVVESGGPAQLLKAVAALKNKADFLLCMPDADLFNPITIKPLVLAALDSRLPIVAFSPAFVRAGAAVGIYPDYTDIGRQTGEMVLRRLRGDDRAGIETPRQVKLAVNQRVARLLGTEFNTASLPVETFR